jgi:hypothetical protein
MIIINKNPPSKIQNGKHIFFLCIESIELHTYLLNLYFGMIYVTHWAMGYFQILSAILIHCDAYDHC